MAGSVLCGTASAQPATLSFDELAGVLQPGQLIVVTDDTGRKTKGDVADLTTASLVLLERDQLGTRRPMRFGAAAVAQIRRTASLWNGILIGAGIGVGVTMAVVRYRCGSNDPECSANAGGVLGFTLVPAFGAAGALIDRLIGHTLVYRAGTLKGPSVAVSPRLGPGQASMALSVRF